MGETRISDWPGPHFGTGRNDHIHHWQEYRVSRVFGVIDMGPQVVIRACQICGLPHPDDATLELAYGRVNHLRPEER